MYFYFLNIDKWKKEETAKFSILLITLITTDTELATFSGRLGKSFEKP